MPSLLYFMLHLAYLFFFFFFFFEGDLKLKTDLKAKWFETFPFSPLPPLIYLLYSYSTKPFILFPKF